VSKHFFISVHFNPKIHIFSKFAGRIFSGTCAEILTQRAIPYRSGSVFCKPELSDSLNANAIPVYCCHVFQKTELTPLFHGGRRIRAEITGAGI
jgi:hypothetical protein